MNEPENPCDKKNEDMEVCQELTRIFGRRDVDVEWSVCTDASDDMVGAEGEHVRYCPQVDFIVGPLNITKDEEELAEMRSTYDGLYEQFEGLFTALYNRDMVIEKEVSKSLSKSEKKCIELLNIERKSSLVTNFNPRCFICIEFEKHTKEKHVLGGILHASALGKVGIILTPDEDEKQYERVMRIRRYLRFCVQAGKMGYNTNVERNTILLPRDEFLGILRKYPFSQ